MLGKRYVEDGVAQSRAILGISRGIPRPQRTSRRSSCGTSSPTTRRRRSSNAWRDIFRDSEGDLPSVHGALIELPQAWSQQTTKFKTPHEFVISALRMLDSVPEQPQQMSLLPSCSLGQRPYTPGSPAGWPDKADQWDGPDALLEAHRMGQRAGRAPWMRDSSRLIVRRMRWAMRCPAYAHRASPAQRAQRRG